ncbi:hypothetical protein [Deinococcus sp. QL22]|uniref:hypothetical protein n=1 Tax=Deinococcus sp. QL22 TaxID=2939437 RepID=UPI002017B010|nr:hypothetical protein [Deinococcus sp. QL22]UQN06486.1 hypothetical protein M1R55_00785 [Deinococcus sp. QL22]
MIEADLIAGESICGALESACITARKVIGGRQRPLPVPLSENWEDERHSVRHLAHLL